MRSGRLGIEIVTRDGFHGSIEATNSSMLRISTTVDQGATGRIASDGGTVRFADATINGGLVENVSGLVEVDNGHATFDSTTIEGEVQISNARVLTLRNDTELNGLIVVNRDGSSSGTQLQSATTGTISGVGEIFLNDTFSSPVGRAQLTQGDAGLVTTLGEGIAVTGQGYIRGETLNVRGTLAPGRLGSARGETATLDASGTVNLSPTARVEIQVGGRESGEFDRITGNAVINLAGTLEASAIAGFEPGMCENFTIISGSAINGEFDALVTSALGGNQRWRLFYAGDTVELTVSLGPEPIELPNLVGQQLGPATDTLRAAGFEVEVERILGGIFGTVRSMSPAAGEMAVPGTTIVLQVV